MNETDVNEAIGYLRGFFPDNLYVGGSYAFYKYFKHIYPTQPQPKDVDIFILGNRRLETWALDSVLRNKFYDVDHTHAPEYYRIENQFKRVKCKYKKISFDLIFCNLSLLSLIDNNTASTLSKIYYKVGYSPNLLNLDRLSIDPIKCLLQGNVFVNEPMATEKHLLKIEDRCKLYNFNYIRNK